MNSEYKYVFVAIDEILFITYLYLSNYIPNYVSISTYDDD